MKNRRCLEIYNMINELLCKHSITKTDLSKKIGLKSSVALSYQLKKLKDGEPINLKIIIILEEMTGEKIFNF